jgi:hypothetical protein
MARLNEETSRLACVVAMFPGRTEEILRLSLRDPDFRDLCEDLADAQSSLSRLSAYPGPVERPELAEYRTIIAELEDQVRAHVARECP